MRMASLANSVNEFVSIPEDTGIVVSEFDESLEPVQVIEELGLITGDTEEFGPCLSLFLLEFLDSPLFHGLSTPDALFLVARSVALAPGAGIRRDRVALVFLDIDPVSTRDCPVVRLAEHGHVPRSNVASSVPPMVVFDVSLVHALGGEVRGRRLPHPGEGHVGVRDIGSPCALLEDFQLHLVADVLWLAQFAPEWSIRIVRGWMDVQPLPEIRG